MGGREGTVIEQDEAQWDGIGWDGMAGKYLVEFNIEKKKDGGIVITRRNGKMKGGNFCGSFRTSSIVALSSLQPPPLLLFLLLLLLLLPPPPPPLHLNARSAASSREKMVRSGGRKGREKWRVCC